MLRDQPGLRGPGPLACGDIGRRYGGISVGFIRSQTLSQAPSSSTIAAIRPAARLRGEVSLPGDKSISHRSAMIASLGSGESRISNYSTAADCLSTLQCLAALGVDVRRDGGRVIVRGNGLGRSSSVDATSRCRQLGIDHSNAIRHSCRTTFHNPDQWRRKHSRSSDEPHHRTIASHGCEN